MCLAALPLFLVSRPATAQSTGLYDVDTVRSFYLTFAQNDWWSQLTKNRTSKTDIPATLVVDNVTYQSVGVRFRGTSSYVGTGNSQKKSFNLTMDASVAGQALMGYDSLNLSNSYNDPTFLREVISYQLMRSYMPAPKAAFIKLYINNSYWGIYINVQQPDKKMMGEWYADSSGNRYRCDPPSFSGYGKSNLSYLGTNVTSYQAAYDLKTPNNTTLWTDLINLCSVLNNTTLANMEQQLPGIFNIDQAMWYLALQITMLNLDSYIGRGNDYYLYNDVTNGQLATLPWDMNESFGGFRAGLTMTGMIQLDPFWNSSSTSNRPLTYRAFQVPAWRARYLAHIRTIIRERFNWTHLGPLITKYQKMIEADVKADTKKLYTDQQFYDNVTKSVTLGRNVIPGLKEVVDGRTKYLLGRTDISSPAPSITALAHTPTIPKPNQSIVVTAKITGTAPFGSPLLHYRTKGAFTRLTMRDDGKSGDGAANDGIFGATIPARPMGSQVDYYVSAQTNSQNGGAMSFGPTTAAFNAPSFRVDWPTRSSNILINELLAKNVTGLRDNYSELEDWVELVNTSTSAVNIGGMYLTDNVTNPTKWQIPSNTTVPAGGTVLFWCDGDTNQGANHVSFKLSASGERIALFDKDGFTRLDQLVFGPQQPDISTGRLFDGKTTWVTVLTPTPNKPNDLPGGCGSRGYSALAPLGHRMVFSVLGLPQVNSTFRLQLANGPKSGLAAMYLSGSPNHFPLLPGLTLLLGTPLLGPVNIPTKADGSFDFPIRVPNNSSLALVRFYVQLAGVDTAGFTFSNAIELAACK
jgi:hypothetical protein